MAWAGRTRSVKLSEVSRRTVSWLLRLAVNDAEMTMEKNMKARLTRRTAQELPAAQGILPFLKM